MSSSKRSHPKRGRGRPRTGERKPVVQSPSEAPASLPLPGAGETLPLVPTATVAPAKPLLPEHSSIRQTAIEIYMMRSAGMSEDAIAAALGLAKSTLPGYVYRASKMGWLDEHIQSVKDHLEHKTMHKVMANLDEALLDETRNEKTGLKVKTHVALKVAEGALFPKVAAAPAQNNAMMGIRIEIVGGDNAPTVREGTVVAAPAYVDAEVVEKPE